MINIIVASSLCSTSCVARTRMSNWSIESLGGKPKVNLKAFSFFRLTCKALFFRVIVNSVSDSRCCHSSGANLHHT